MREFIDILERSMIFREGRRVPLHFTTRFGQEVNLQAVQSPNMTDIRAMVAASEFGVRGIVGNDGFIFIWPGALANHIAVANELGYEANQYGSFWFLHENDDPFEPNDDWGVDGDEPIVDGIRILPGKNVLSQLTIQRLGFPESY